MREVRPGTQRRNWKAELLSIPGSITSDRRSLRCQGSRVGVKGMMLAALFTAHSELAFFYGPGPLCLGMVSLAVGLAFIKSIKIKKILHRHALRPNSSQICPQANLIQELSQWRLSSQMTLGYVTLMIEAKSILQLDIQGLHSKP